MYISLQALQVKISDSTWHFIKLLQHFYPFNDRSTIKAVLSLSIMGEGRGKGGHNILEYTFSSFFFANTGEKYILQLSSSSSTFLLFLMVVLRWREECFSFFFFTCRSVNDTHFVGVGFLRGAHSVWGLLYITYGYLDKSL